MPPGRRDSRSRACSASPRDGTARRRALEALEQQQAVLKYVIANVPHAIFWKDREGRFLGCNQIFLNDADVAALEHLLGKTDLEFWGAEPTRTVFVKVDREVMEGGTPMPRHRGDAAPPGRPAARPAHRARSRSWASAAQVTGLLGIYADITERKQMEVELQRAKEAARRCGPRQGRVPHDDEPRVPDAALAHPRPTGVAPRRARTSRCRRGRGRISSASQRSGRRLHRLVDDVLDLQKIEAGKMQLEWEAVDAAALVADMIEEAQPAATRARASRSRCEVGPRALGSSRSIGASSRRSR